MVIKAKRKLMEMFEDGIKVAEVDVTYMTEDEVKAIIALQDMAGRTFEYQTIEPYEFPELQGKEGERC